MGTFVNVYIGPYIEINKDIKVEVEKVKRVCPNHPNIKMKKDKYCSVCGTLIEDVQYIDNEDFDVNIFLHNIDETYSNVIWAAQKNILISNKAVPNRYRISDHYESAVEFKDVDAVSTNQKLWLMEQCKNYIDSLKEKLGEDNVEIKWGFVSYYI